MRNCTIKDGLLAALLLVYTVGCGTVQNYRGEELLQAAAQGHLTEVNKLLDQGVDVNFEDYDGGRTALFYATCNGHRDVVKLLLRRGADVRIKDHDGRIAADDAQSPEMRALFKK